MNRHPALVAATSSFAMVLALSSSGLSQEAAPAAQPAAAPAPADPTAEMDGGRFRFGIGGTVGLESISVDPTGSLSGTMYGIDARFGYQINNLLAIYAQPHLSFGSLNVDGATSDLTGATGTFVGTVMAEATFIDRIFVGGGLGYGVLNNPSGLAIDIRAGGYPLMSKSDDHPRRKGLMLGVDFRSIMTDIGTGILVMGQLGYEAF